MPLPSDWVTWAHLDHSGLGLLCGRAGPTQVHNEAFKQNDPITPTLIMTTAKQQGIHMRS
jgi:hypothetical protein